MRILYVINSGIFGGAEKHIKDLTTGMTQKGHLVYIWCQEGPIVQKYKDAGATVVTQFPKYDIDLPYIFRLKKYIQQEKIDIVHTHDLKAGVNAQLAASLAGVKAQVGHVHTPISQWQISKFKKILNILMYAFVGNFFLDKEIALSQHGKQQKVSTGILSGKIHVIPNYVEKPQNPDLAKKQEFLKKWGFETNFVVGCIGRISQEKGQELLIKAFYSLLNDFPNIRLALIGGGPLQEKCQNLINELKINDKAIITGVFPDEDKSTLFSTLNLFVFPSLAEGFGYVPLEALSLDVPVLSSDLPVLQEVLGDKATYFKTQSVTNLAEQIRYCIYNYDQIKADAADSTWVQMLYGFDKFINSYQKLYEEILK